MYQDSQLLIDGVWARAAPAARIPVVNPATGETIGTRRVRRPRRPRRALEAAAKGFKVWEGVAPYERSKIMRKAAQPAARAHRPRRDR